MLSGESKNTEDLLSTLDSELSTEYLALSRIRILVVDDDTDSRDFLVFALEAAGAEIAAASSAQEALNMLPTFQPMVLVSDIGMPDQDGYCLIRSIRELPYEKGGAVPAIALTAYAAEADRETALSSGFQQHIAKPVDPIECIGAIIQLLQQN